MTSTRTIQASALIFALAIFAAPAFADSVPDVVGLRAAKASELVETAGYVCERRYDASQPSGVVFDQSPGGFATRPAGTPVSIAIGGSAPVARDPVTVPGPTPGVDRPPTGTLPDTPPGPGPSTPDPDLGPTAPDPVVASTPVPGSRGVLGLPAARVPSTNGPRIPSVLGESRATALQALGAWNVVEEQSLGLPDLVGKIINQRPTPGNTLAAGEDVVVVVAIARAPSRDHRFVPNLKGKSVEEVRWALEANGFGAALFSVASSTAKEGRAVSQRPGPGTILLAGKDVTVHIGRGQVVGSPLDRPPVDPAPVTPPIDTPPVAPPPVAPPPVDRPPSGDLPPTPPPTDVPDPIDTPDPVDTPEPPPIAPEKPKVVLPEPTLRSPPRGESYPRAYGATFEWSPVRGATSYEWELQEEQPSGAWETSATKTLDAGTTHRPDRMKRGRYRWRVRAMSTDDPGIWSEWFRLYMY